MEDELGTWFLSRWFGYTQLNELFEHLQKCNLESLASALQDYASVSRNAFIREPMHIQDIKIRDINEALRINRSSSRRKYVVVKTEYWTITRFNPMFQEDDYVNTYNLFFSSSSLSITQLMLQYSLEHS